MTYDVKREDPFARSTWDEHGTNISRICPRGVVSTKYQVFSEQVLLVICRSKKRARRGDV